MGTVGGKVALLHAIYAIFFRFWLGAPSVKRRGKRTQRLNRHNSSFRGLCRSTGRILFGQVCFAAIARSVSGKLRAESEGGLRPLA